MRTRVVSGAVALLLVGAAVLSHRAPVAAQAAQTGRGAARTTPRNTAWFGVTPSPGFQARRAAGDPRHRLRSAPRHGPRRRRRIHTTLKGDAIRRHLETIVGFSKWSRETKEVGTGQLWGRITGLPSGQRTMDWVEQRFREANVPARRASVVRPGGQRGACGCRSRGKCASMRIRRLAPARRT